MLNVSLRINSPYIHQNTGIRQTPVNFRGLTQDTFVQTTPKIVQLTKKNLKEIFPIYLKYRESANIKSSIKEVEKYLKAEVKRTEDKFYTAQVNNKIIGFLHCGKEFSTLTSNERLRIKAMFVDDEYRGKGIAKKLISALRENSPNLEIIVKARRSNEHSPYLYRNCGFEEDKNYFHFVLPPAKKM